MNMELQGKTALVTGASSGIGRATAIHLAGLGANVIVNYNRSSREAADTKFQIEKGGSRAFIEQADVSDSSSVQAMFERIQSYTDGIDILVNNAGINILQYILFQTEENWDRIIDCNLKGAYLCSQLALRSMIKKQGGSIIHVASTIVFKGGIRQAGYSASKGGLIGLTRAMAKEVGRLGVRVNAVAPGPVDTNLNNMSEEQKREVIALTPLNRMGSPEDIAAAISFLCSDHASFITGEVLTVDGGLSL